MTNGMNRRRTEDENFFRPLQASAVSEQDGFQKKDSCPYPRPIHCLAQVGLIVEGSNVTSDAPVLSEL